LRILFLTQIIPYPPDAGPKVKTWHVIRYLAERDHQIILASFVRQEEIRHVPKLREVCADVITVPLKRSRLTDMGYWLRSQMTGRPFLIERDDRAAMRRVIREQLANGDIDCIHADQLGMCQFALEALKQPLYPTATLGESAGNDDHRHPKLIFDAHNAVWTIVGRLAPNMPAIMRPLLKLEAHRVKRYEGRMVASFDRTLAVTEVDKQALLQAAGEAGLDPGQRQEKIAVIPIAVNTQQLSPVTRQPGSQNILTLGTLHYPPNADGIRWFLREVFPLIQQSQPGASLTIIGKNPPEDFIEFAEHSEGRIRVTGYVPELAPYLQKAAVMVVPVRAGSGLRVRILEAFARGMPVVTTSVGLEGIDARPGVDVLVEDDPQHFAAAGIEVIRNSELQTRLAINGRRLAESYYDWQVVLQRLDKVYQAIEKQRNVQP